MFLNEGNTLNNFVKVVLKNEPASVGAKVVIKLKTGNHISSFFVPAQGLCSSQPSIVIIGIGKETAIRAVVIHYANGKKETYESPQVNTTLYAGKNKEEKGT